MRSVPAFLVAALMASVGSIVLGFLIAAWTFAGTGPAQAAPPPAIAARAVDTADDGWRAQGYERIGVWDHEVEAPR